MIAGHVLHKEAHARMDRLVVNHVVVIEQEHCVAPRLEQLVDQGREGLVHQIDTRGPQQRLQRLAKLGKRRTQRRDHVAPEPDGLVVTLVQRKPRHLAVAKRRQAPLRQQQRLAAASRTSDQRERPRQTIPQRLNQHTPRNKLPQERRLELRPEEHEREFPSRDAHSRIIVATCRKSSAVTISAMLPATPAAKTTRLNTTHTHREKARTPALATRR